MKIGASLTRANAHPGFLSPTLLLHILLLLVLQAWLSLLLPTAAQADDFITEEDLFDPLPSVKSATRLVQTLDEVPAAITLIDRSMIEASGAINIADLFRLVPGFQAYHVNASKFGVTSHGQGGLHPSRLEVTVDGRSVYLSLLSTVDWSTLGIAIQDIDYIEVVRGSNVPTQGSNAFVGAINIITREPLQDSGTNITATAGSIDTRDFYIRHNDNWGPLNLRFSANYHENDGFGTGNYYDDMGNKTDVTTTIPDGGDIGQFNLRGTYTPSLTDRLDFQMGYSDGEIGVGRPSELDYYGPREVYSHYQTITWNHTLANQNEFKLQAYHNYLRYDHSVPLTIAAGLGGFPLPAFDVDLGYEKGTSQQVEVEGELTQFIDEDNRVVWGAAIRYDSLESDVLLNSDDKATNNGVRLSTNWEHKINHKWIFNTGAMLEDSDLIDSKVSPRVAVNYLISPGKTLRSSISHAYREPSLLETDEYFVIYFPDDPALAPFNGRQANLITYPSQGLEPEQIDSAEIGYLYQSSDNAWLVDTRLFYEDINDGIATKEVAYTPVFPDIDLSNNTYRQYDNIADWQVYGLELQTKWRPRDDTWFHFAYSYTETNGSYNNGVRVVDLGEYAPTHTLALLGAHQFGHGITGSFTFYHTSSMKWDDGDNSDDDPSLSHERLDARIAKDFELGGETDAKLELIIQNLLATYTEFDLNNDFDTRVFVRFGVDF